MSSSTAEGKTTSRRKRGASSSAAPAASASSGEHATTNGMFVCPECGKAVKSAAGLGSHRYRAHNVQGSSRGASSAASKSAGKSGSAGTGSAKTSSVKPGTASATNGAARRGAQATTSRRRNRSTQGNGRQFDRDKLLSVLFPEGVPAKVSVIQALTPWLDEAERLSRIR